MAAGPDRSGTVDPVPFCPAPEVVLVQGLSLGEPAWNDVMWGSPTPGRHGRLLRAAVYARRNGAHRLVIGSGASRRAGRCDAEYALDLLRTGAAHLAAHFDESVATTYAWVEETVDLDTASTSPDEEIYQLFDRCVAHGWAPTICTSPARLPSTVTAAVALTAEGRFLDLRGNLRFIAADTDIPLAVSEPTARRRR